MRKKTANFTEEDILTFRRAYAIAISTLRDRYTPMGIFAGKYQFSDIWARHSNYAAMGSLLLGDFDIVKQNLKTLFDYMNKDGQIPHRIGQQYQLLKFWGIHAKKPKPRYTEDKSLSITTDNNSLQIILLDRYIELSEDIEFLKSVFEKAKKVINWNFKQDKNNNLLIEEDNYSNWTDSLKRNGTVFYTNVMHFRAVTGFAKCCKRLKKQDEANFYFSLAEKIKKELNNNFWNGDYFIDRIDRVGKKHQQFSTEGNVFAIIFDLATPEQSTLIHKTIENLKLNKGFTTRTCFPKYRFKDVYLPFYFMNLADYHNGLEWLWVGCADAVSKNYSNLTDLARNNLLKIAKKIVEFNNVYEVYDKGKPVQRFWYKSEKWYAWSSGFYVWAAQRLKCHNL